MGGGAETNTPASGNGESAGEPSRLCRACLSVLTKHDLRPSTFYPHHGSLKGFVKASLMKCYICLWLFSMLPENYQEDLRLIAEGKVSDNMIAHNDVDIDDLRGMLRFYQSLPDLKGGFKPSFTRIEFRSSRDCNAEVEVLVYLNPSYKGYYPRKYASYKPWLTKFWKDIARHIRRAWRDGLVLMKSEVLTGLEIQKILPSNTGSFETWWTVEKWIQDCSKHHSCMAGASAKWYPTRLVERLPGETFRVVRSDSSIFQPDSGGRYITLSHRWGNSEFLKLTTDNIATLEKGLPVSILRRIFQETLIIAQRMGISYIWIDSLCIIQDGDDQADWREESKTMEQVYSNSFCNISADWGDESNGLFFERTTVLTAGPQIRRQSTDFHCNHGILAWLRPILRLNTVPSQWHPFRLSHTEHYLSLFEDMTDSPLNHRGWVLQERLLAPRVLHFSHQQVSWECAESMLWERAPICLEKLQPLLTSSRIECLYKSTKASMQRLSLSGISEETLDHCWRTLLCKYTKSDLTKHSDKLIAFAGIARQLAPFQGQYVAGLWAKSMPQALLWVPRSHDWSTTQGNREVSVEYHAPTFSWAAADGEVHVNETLRVRLAASATFIKQRDKAIASAATETIFTGHVFGPLTTPVVEVRVRGMLRSCRRVVQQLDPVLSSMDQRVSNLGCACPSSTADDRVIDLRSENGRAFRVLYDRISDKNEGTAFTMYYYAIIAYNPFTEQMNNDSYSSAAGLLLKSVDASMARFARVGLWEHFHGYGQHIDMRVPLGNERDLPAWDYDEATGEHTFYIV